MPMLLAWQDKLRQSGAAIDLVFVSIDDDDRQLRHFLEQQPASGVRATYFLADESPRKDFLTAIGAKESPELPIHAIFAPSGQLGCFIQGAVEESDYPAIAALVGTKR